MQRAVWGERHPPLACERGPQGHCLEAWHGAWAWAMQGCCQLRCQVPQAHSGKRVVGHAWRPCAIAAISATPVVLQRRQQQLQRAGQGVAARQGLQRAQRVGGVRKAGVHAGAYLPGHFGGCACPTGPYTGWQEAIGSCRECKSGSRSSDLSARRASGPHTPMAGPAALTPSREAHDLARGHVNVDVVEAGARGQARHGHHAAHEWEHKAGAHGRAHVPDGQHKVGGRACARGVARAHHMGSAP